MTSVAPARITRHGRPVPVTGSIGSGEGDAIGDDGTVGMTTVAVLVGVGELVMVGDIVGRTDGVGLGWCP
jgi:hypothetical protein